jgi:hypothetical protein
MFRVGFMMGGGVGRRDLDIGKAARLQDTAIFVKRP